jgi:hypothetical protein
MNRFNNDFYDYTADKLDEIARIFNNQFGDEGSAGGGGSGTDAGGGGGIGGAAGGSTSKFGKFMGKAGKVMAIANGIERSINGTLSSLKSMYGELNHILEPWAKADKAASKYAKTLAMTEQGMKNLRKNTIDNVVNSHIGINYNISTDELIEAQQKYVQSVGRSLRIDNTQQETLAAMTAVMGDKSTELAAAFENFGVNLNGVGDHAFKMFTEASKSGLSFEKYSDNVAKNIKIAQNYTFKNGLRGLESMAKKATALKLDMGQVASFADKVSTIEGSIDVASKLQVLGGQFAAIADPMAMLSEGLMDMEGLTDRIVKMVGGLGNFNKATGEVEVSAFNKQRIKAAAQAMGMDYSQLMESVNASTRREAIDREISSSAHARGLNDDMKELLRNTATFDKNGKAGVSINGEFVNLEDLTNEDYEVLVKETQDEAADIKDIARMLRSIEDIQQGTKKQYQANKAQIIEQTGAGDFTKRVIDGIGQANGFLKMIAYGSIFKSIASIGLTALGIPFNIISNFTNLKGFGKGLARGGGRGVSAANSMGEGAVSRGGSKYGGRLATRFGESRLGQQAGRFGASSITRVDKLGTKLSQKGYTKLGNAVSRHAATQAEKYGMKSIAKQGGKRIAAKTATKIGTKMAAGVAKGGVLGIVGAAGNIATDILVDKGKIKKGGAAHTAMKVGSTALEGAALGAMIGSAFPGIGTAIGAAVGAVGGAVVGAVKMAKIKREVKVDEKLSKLGIERKGSYGARSYKLINKALESGEISDRMRRKLEKKGDTAILEAIDRKKEEKEKNETKIAKGKFNIKNAYFNGEAFGKGNGFSPLDMLNPLKATQKTLSLTGSLLKGTTEAIGGIKGIPETGKGITPHQRVQTVSLNGNQNRGAYDINISGTITLMSANGQEVDITDNLLSDQTFVRNLTDKIIAQTGQNNYGVQRADVNSMGRM